MKDADQGKPLETDGTQKISNLADQPGQRPTSVGLPHDDRGESQGGRWHVGAPRGSKRRSRRTLLLDRVRETPLRSPKGAVRDLERTDR